MSSITLAAADIGNTSIALGLFAGDQLVHSLKFPSSADHAKVVAEARAKLSGIKLPERLPCAVASVAPTVTTSLQALSFDVFRSDSIVLGVDEGIPIPNHTDAPEQVGFDRLVNGLAVRELYGAPSVVLDFGTAITFDIVDPNGAYVGGLISPGLQLVLDALHERTAQLPRVQLPNMPKLIGKTTAEAIGAGVFYGCVGLVRNTLQELRKELGELKAVVATGGDSILIAPAVPEIDHMRADLTLHGVRLAYEINRKA